jgi:uncharacterized protein YlaI
MSRCLHPKNCPTCKGKLTKRLRNNHWWNFFCAYCDKVVNWKKIVPNARRSYAAGTAR